MGKLEFFAAGGCSILLALVASVTSSSAGEPTREQLIEELRCKANQNCDPPVSRKRSLAQPAKRGLVFREFTEEQRKEAETAADAGKLPSSNVEIYFDYNSATIGSQAAKVLVPLGQALVDPALASYQFLIVGHTDAKGGDAYNQALSERRAAAVKDYLVREFNIPVERLESTGRGRANLKNKNAPLAAENRRVQIINVAPMAAVGRK